MMTMEEKLQTLAKAVGVNGAKYRTNASGEYLLLPEPLPMFGLPTLRFNPYTDTSDFDFIIKETECHLDYGVRYEYSGWNVFINLAIHSISTSDVFFKTVVTPADEGFIAVLRKETLDLLVEVLTASANTADTTRSIKS
jgi:hypothetical protein